MDSWLHLSFWRSLTVLCILWCSINELCSFIDHFKNVPDHYEVLNLLASISVHWQDIGLVHKVSEYELDRLVDGAGSNNSKLSKVIRLRRDTESSPVTWEALISAIEGSLVNNKGKAEEIYDHLHKRKN